MRDIDSNPTPAWDEGYQLGYQTVMANLLASQPSLTLIEYTRLSHEVMRRIDETTKRLWRMEETHNNHIQYNLGVQIGALEALEALERRAKGGLNGG